MVKWGRWVAVLVCTGVLLTTSAFHPGAEPRTIRPWNGGAYGISVEMTLQFDEPLTLQSGTFNVAGTVGHASFYRNDIDDDDQPDEMPLPAGTPVLVSTGLVPLCRSTYTANPELILEARGSDGTVSESHIPLTGLSRLDSVLKDWCSRGVMATLSQSSLTVDGDKTVWLTVTNPGPANVKVTCNELRHGRMHWRQSTITVPAGSSRILVVHATGIHHTAAMRQAPWSLGLLVANSGSTGSQTVYLTRG